MLKVESKDLVTISLRASSFGGQADILITLASNIFSFGRRASIKDTAQSGDQKRLFSAKESAEWQRTSLIEAWNLFKNGESLPSPFAPTMTVSPTHRGDVVDKFVKEKLPMIFPLLPSSVGKLNANPYTFDDVSHLCASIVKTIETMPSRDKSIVFLLRDIEASEPPQSLWHSILGPKGIVKNHARLNLRSTFAPDAVLLTPSNDLYIIDFKSGSKDVLEELKYKIQVEVYASIVEHELKKAEHSESASAAESILPGVTFRNTRSKVSVNKVRCFLMNIPFMHLKHYEIANVERRSLLEIRLQKGFESSATEVNRSEAAEYIEKFLDLICWLFDSEENYDLYKKLNVPYPPEQCDEIKGFRSGSLDSLPKSLFENVSSNKFAEAHRKSPNCLWCMVPGCEVRRWRRSASAVALQSPDELASFATTRFARETVQGEELPKQNGQHITDLIDFFAKRESHQQRFLAEVLDSATAMQANWVKQRAIGDTIHGQSKIALNVNPGKGFRLTPLQALLHEVSKDGGAFPDLIFNVGIAPHLIIESPPNSGKMWTAAMLAAIALKKMPGRMVVYLVPTRKLAEFTAEDVAKVLCDYPRSSENERERNRQMRSYLGIEEMPVSSIAWMHGGGTGNILPGKTDVDEKSIRVLIATYDYALELLGHNSKYQPSLLVCDEIHTRLKADEDSESTVETNRATIFFSKLLTYSENFGTHLVFMSGTMESSWATRLYQSSSFNVIRSQFKSGHIEVEKKVVYGSKYDLANFVAKKLIQCHRDTNGGYSFGLNPEHCPNIRSILNDVVSEVVPIYNQATPFIQVASAFSNVNLNRNKLIVVFGYSSALLELLAAEICASLPPELREQETILVYSSGRPYEVKYRVEERLRSLTCEASPLPLILLTTNAIAEGIKLPTHVAITARFESNGVPFYSELTKNQMIHRAARGYELDGKIPGYAVDIVQVIPQKDGDSRHPHKDEEYDNEMRNLLSCARIEPVSSSGCGGFSPRTVESGLSRLEKLGGNQEGRDRLQDLITAAIDEGNIKPCIDGGGHELTSRGELLLSFERFIDPRRNLDRREVYETVLVNLVLAPLLLNKDFVRSFNAIARPVNRKEPWFGDIREYLVRKNGRADQVGQLSDLGWEIAQALMPDDFLVKRHAANLVVPIIERWGDRIRSQMQRYNITPWTHAQMQTLMNLIWSGLFFVKFEFNYLQPSKLKYQNPLPESTLNQLGPESVHDANSEYSNRPRKKTVNVFCRYFQLLQEERSTPLFPESKNPSMALQLEIEKAVSDAQSLLLAGLNNHSRSKLRTRIAHFGFDNHPHLIARIQEHFAGLT